MPISPDLRLLETTLRDGSYVIDFAFTAGDTAVLCRELEKLGFELIEIGHGIGLGASEFGHGKAAETDAGYMQAAAGVLSKAKWGMFCIPGIARLEHIDLGVDHGMGFVRVGTNASDAAQGEPFIERAKTKGLFVAANFMKSYSMAPAEFGRKAKLAQSFGADVVYVVDSAGGMMPRDMESYIRAVQDACDVPIGFHGHDNLGLSVANSLRAAELGAVIIDTSLQGMGRSAGNTPTELFLLVLERVGHRLNIDPLAVMDLAEAYVKPLLTRVGLDSVDMISGYAQFHTSYMGLIREYAAKYNVDPRRLITAVCARDRVNAPRALVESLARELQNSRQVFEARFKLGRYHGAEQEPEPPSTK